MITVVGQLAATPGLILWNRDGRGGGVPATLPAANYATQQRRLIRALMEHDHGIELGHAVHLERSEATGLMAVLRLGDEHADLFDDDGDWYLSAGTTAQYGGVAAPLHHARIREISLVRSTANLGVHPVAWTTTDVATDGGGHPLGLPLSWHDVMRRAHWRASHWKFDPAQLDVIDIDEMKRPTPPPPTPDATQAPALAGHQRSRTRLDGVELTDAQADMALRVYFGAEYASDGSLIR